MRGWASQVPISFIIKKVGKYITVTKERRRKIFFVGLRYSQLIAKLIEHKADKFFMSKSEF